MQDTRWLVCAFGLILGCLFAISGVAEIPNIGNTYGTARGQRGKLVAGAVLADGTMPGPPFSQPATSGSNGTFNVTALPPAAHTLCVQIQAHNFSTCQSKKKQKGRGL